MNKPELSDERRICSDSKFVVVLASQMNFCLDWKKAIVRFGKIISPKIKFSFSLKPIQAFEIEKKYGRNFPFFATLNRPNVRTLERTFKNPELTRIGFLKN